MLGLPFDRRSHMMIEWNFFFSFGRKASSTVASSSSVIGINYTPSVLSFGKQSNRFLGLNVVHTAKFDTVVFLCGFPQLWHSIYTAGDNNESSLTDRFVYLRHSACVRQQNEAANRQQAVSQQLAWNHMKYYNLSNIIGGELLTSRTCRWLPAICPHCLPTTTNLTELSLSTRLAAATSLFLIVLCVQFFEDFSEKPSNNNRVSRENTMRGLEF